MSISLLNLYLVLLSYLIKTEPVCHWYKRSGVILFRVSVALHLITDGVVDNSISKHFILSYSIDNPRTLCTLLINCCRPYEVNAIQTILNKVIDNCFVTDSAPVTFGVARQDGKRAIFRRD